MLANACCHGTCIKVVANVSHVFFNVLYEYNIMLTLNYSCERVA